MSPTSTMYDGRDIRATDTIDSSQFLLRNAVLGVSVPNFLYLLLRQLRTMVQFAMLVAAFRKVGASFCHHVLDIIKFRSKEKMRESTAGRIVTVVKDTEAIGDSPIRHFPYESVSIDTVIVCSGHDAIAVLGCPCPQPTRPELGLMRWRGAILVDFGPEVGDDLRSKGILVAHLESPSQIRGATPSDALTSRGLNITANSINWWAA